MKKYRSRRGKRNLLILYCLLGIVAVSMFFVLNSIPNIKQSPESSMGDDNTDAVAVTPSFDNESEEIKNDFIRLSESEFVSDMLSLLGKSVTSNDFVMYGVSRLGSELKSSDFNKVSSRMLQIGDIAVSEQGFGFYMGMYNNNPVYIVSPLIGSIFSAEEPVVSLVYDAACYDELLFDAYPVKFTEYYHLTDNPYSADCGLDYTSYIKPYPEKDLEYAKRIYEINKYLRSKNFAKASETLNVRVAKQKDFFLNRDLFVEYYLGQIAVLEQESEKNIEDIYLSISSLYPTSNGCIVGLSNFFVETDSLVKASPLEYTLYSNGTYMPFNIFTESNYAKYGFAHLSDGEAFADENSVPEEYAGGSGYLVQKEDGTWVLRGSGFEQDITHLINK